MKKFKYLKISKTKRLRYIANYSIKKLYIIFFHGFMSDMIGAKPVALEKFCKKQKLNFLKFEYSGHGKSSGKFEEGNITRWTNDAKQLIKSKIKKNNI